MNFIFSIQKLAALCLMIMVCSCSGSQNKNTNHNNGGEIPLETYINVNRSLVEREQQKIKEYVADNSLDMQTTGTGLWYRIDHPGKGPDIQKGKVVVLD
jgi:FKBP-type peptidyl-prolyl cis-trans isomerase FkpA